MSLILGAVAGFILWLILRIIRLGTDIMWYNGSTTLWYNILVCVGGALLIGLWQRSVYTLIILATLSPRRFKLSPIQQQSPAMTPTNTASGPREPPNTRGIITATAIIAILS